MTDQDFRDRLVDHMGRVDARLTNIEASIAKIESGEACPIGIRALERIGTVEKSDTAQWDRITGIERPVRAAVLTGTGAGGVLGAAILWAVQRLLEGNP